MMLLGWRLSKWQHTDEEYFLGGRRMPWFAVGVSLIATLLSSVAYLGTPGVVWRFGFAIFLNTLVGIAITVVLILFVTIPSSSASASPPPTSTWNIGSASR